MSLLENISDKVNIRIENVDKCSSKCEKLWVKFDNRLTFDDHTSILSKKANMKNIKKTYSYDPYELLLGEATEAYRQNSAGNKGTVTKGRKTNERRTKERKSIRITRIIIFHNTLSPCKFPIMDSIILHKRVFCI